MQQKEKRERRLLSDEEYSRLIDLRRKSKGRWQRVREEGEYIGLENRVVLSPIEEARSVFGKVQRLKDGYRLMCGVGEYIVFLYPMLEKGVYIQVEYPIPKGLLHKDVEAVNPKELLRSGWFMGDRRNWKKEKWEEK